MKRSMVRQEGGVVCYRCGACGQWTRKAWLWEGLVYGVCCWKRLRLDSLTAKVAHTREVSAALREEVRRRREGSRG